MSNIRNFAAAAFVAVGAPAFADTQVKASPGVTLTEAAQAKFNRGHPRGRPAREAVPGTSEPSRQFYASAGLTIGEGRAMTLDQVFVAQDQPRGRRRRAAAGVGGEPVAMGTRAYGQGGDYAPSWSRRPGSTPTKAAGMSLTEIAAAKFATESGDD